MSPFFFACLSFGLLGVGFLVGLAAGVRACEKENKTKEQQP